MSKVLVVVTCESDMSSYGGGFTWPESGHVESVEGLHGALWGEGSYARFNWKPDAKWLVVEVDSYKLTLLYNCVEYPEGDVVYCGDQMGATSYIIERLPKDRLYAVVGARVENAKFSSVGDKGVAISGDDGVAYAGRFGEARVGKNGYAFVEKGGKVMVGDRGVAQVAWVDRTTRSKRISTGYIQGLTEKLPGIQYILPNTLYELDVDGNFILSP